MTTDPVDAIRTGNIEALKRLLDEQPELAANLIDGHRTLLHVATDWPGHFPQGVETVKLLIAHGADVNAPFQGGHSETPLHWAASCDDVAVLDALLDGGAEIEAAGGVIGGGTPLADAVAFGQWRAARRLVERGARATLWQAAALGMMPNVQQFIQGNPRPSPEEITNAFWCACHGGQREAAEYLLEHGVDLNWVGHDGRTPLDAASHSGATQVVEWLRSRNAKSAKES